MGEVMGNSHVHLTHWMEVIEATDLNEITQGMRISKNIKQSKQKSEEHRFNDGLEEEVL